MQPFKYEPSLKRIESTQENQINKQLNVTHFLVFGEESLDTNIQYKLLKSVK